MEQAAFGGFQGEHGQKTGRDHEQGEEAGPAYFLDGIHNRPLIMGVGPIRLGGFQFFVGLLHHHDGRIHHGADGDGDAAQRHDVGAHARRAHGQECNQDGNRNGHNGDHGAGDVPEEDQDHERDDAQFLQQRLFQVVDRCQDQLRAVVGRDHFDARR